MSTVFYPWMGVVNCVSLGALFSLGQVVVAVESNRDRASEVCSVANDLSEAFRQAANRASPSLVSVYSMTGPRMTAEWRKREAVRHGRDTLSDNGHSSRAFTDDQSSGIVIDKQGLILTCYHGVADADAVIVVLPDGRSFEPTEVRGDLVADLALIRIEGAGDLAEVMLGNSDDVQVGDWVVTLANPYNMTQSVSAGVVSAAKRWVADTHHPLMQYDASTNPGSSGGALLNLQGEVVGIITGSFGQSDSFQGIGLAVPANVAKQAIEKLCSSTPTQRAYLGCDTQKLPPVIAQRLELPVAGGLYVKDVEKESPAARAGIRQGDVLTHFAGSAIDDNFRPEQLYDEPIPGNIYGLTFYRDGQSIAVKVRMEYPPVKNNQVTTRANLQPSHDSAHFDERLGLGIDKLTTDVALQLHFPKSIEGVLVTSVTRGGQAYKEGIAAGMVVLRLNNHAIRSPEDFRHETRICPQNKPILMLVQSNKGKHLVILDR